ncbi:USP6 N-terminal-like protein [Vulpes lagopus]
MPPLAHLTSTAFLSAAASLGLQGVPPQVQGQEMKEEAQVSSQDIKQIDLDINRTFRNHIMFWDRYGVG